MNEESRRILNMLAEGKVNAQEAEKLLEAVAGRDSDISADGGGGFDHAKPKFLRILVEPKAESKKGDRVNIRIPIMLIKAGVKLGSMLPDEARDKVNSALREKGIHFDLGKINDDSMSEVIKALTRMSIDVDDDEEKVRIFCE